MISRLHGLCRAMAELEDLEDLQPDLLAATLGYRTSARNLLRYTTLRRHGISDLQYQLADLGVFPRTL